MRRTCAHRKWLATRRTITQPAGRRHLAALDLDERAAGILRALGERRGSRGGRRTPRAASRMTWLC